jgi:hypothetical protein
LVEAVTDFVWLVLFPAAVAAGMAALLLRLRPNWPTRRTVVVAAAPVPISMTAICIVVFLNAATASRESCGVDACGMAMMFAMVGVGYAMAAFVLGAGSAALIMLKVARS